LEKTCDAKSLADIARRVRIEVVKMLFSAQSGHPGGSMCAVDMLVALYFAILRIDPTRPDWSDRDRFVLSKGHAAPALYAVLAEAGFFSKNEFKTFRQVGGLLQGHPTVSVPGIEMTTGSLGIGFSTACGMALGGKMRKAPWRVYALIGDGEQQAGIIWEAALAAAHHKLDNLIAFTDFNGLQNDGFTRDVIDLDPLPAKWADFNWHVQEIDGHDFDQIISAVKRAEENVGRPSMIVAHTIKGKGTSYSESTHYHPPTEEQMKEALKELGAKL